MPTECFSYPAQNKRIKTKRKETGFIDVQRMRDPPLWPRRAGKSGEPQLKTEHVQQCGGHLVPTHLGKCRDPGTERSAFHCLDPFGLQHTIAGKSISSRQTYFPG